MAVLNKLSDVYEVLDLAVAGMSGTPDQVETLERLVVKLKNRRGMLSELVNTNPDSAARSFAQFTAPATAVANPVDHLG